MASKVIHYVTLKQRQMYEDAISCQDLAEHSRARKVFYIRGRLYVIASGTLGPQGALDAYEVVEAKKFSGQTFTYAELTIKKPGTRYDGMKFKCQKAEYVFLPGGMHLSIQCNETEQAKAPEEPAPDYHQGGLF